MIPIPIADDFLVSLLNIVYEYPLLLWAYKSIKGVVRILTGSHELARIVSRPIPTNHKRIVLYQVDRSLLFSSKLEKERRMLESTETKDALTTIQRIFTLKNIPAKAQLQLKDCLLAYHSSFILVHELNTKASQKYNPTDLRDERMLAQLWELMMPHKELTGMISAQWQEIGFQGRDPSTDFRGMGLLGLQDLFYYAKMHTKYAQHTFKVSQHQTAWFSYAIVGINITAFALHLCRTRHLQLFFYTYGVNVQTYHEFYCWLMYNFGKYWSEYKYPITVLDFERVFKEFQNKVLEILVEDRIVLLNEEKM